MNGTITVGPTLAIGLALLVVIAAVVTRLGGIGSWRATVVAGVRAAGQLAVVSLVIVAVLKSPWWTGAFVLLMFAIASVTSAGRIGAVRDTARAAVAIGAGAVPVLALLFGAGIVPLKPVAVVPIAGIVIGGAMTAASMAARRALLELRDRHGEYEAALSLGLLPRDAALEVCRPSAGEAMIPVLDQTRTVGLVTLPGAFVGVLLGGASPVQAGAVQLLVLISLVAAESITVLVAVELVAAGRFTTKVRQRIF